MAREDHQDLQGTSALPESLVIKLTSFKKIYKYNYYIVTQGETGQTGKNGELGPRGPKGDRGKRGIKGHRGEMGLNGQ